MSSGLTIGFRLRRSRRAIPGPGASSCRSRKRRKTRSKKARCSASVRIWKSGSTPASIGRSRRMVAQKAWMVPMDASSIWESAASSRAVAAAPSGPAAACSIRSSRPWRIRSLSSPAAFSVKVIAATCPIRAVSTAIISTTRSTTDVVFPVPAAASTISVVSWSRRMRSRAAASGSALTADPGSRRLRRGRRRTRPGPSSARAPRAAGRRPGGSRSSRTPGR